MILSEFNLYGSLIQDDRFTLDNSVFTLFNTEYNHQFVFNRTPRRCTKKVYRNVTLVGNNKLTKNLNVYKLSEDLPHLYEVVVTYGDAVLKTIINETRLRGNEVEFIDYVIKHSVNRIIGEAIEGLLQYRSDLCFNAIVRTHGHPLEHSTSYDHGLLDWVKKFNAV